MAFKSISERWRWWIATVALALMAAWLAGAVAGRQALSSAQAATETDARLRAALLDSEIARFRLLPTALADDRDVAAALTGSDADRRKLNGKLESLSRTTGAAVIYLVGTNGFAISASNWQAARSFVGNDYRFRGYFIDARRNGVAEQFALGTVSGRPGLYISRLTPGGGVIVVKLEFDRIEQEWAQAGGDTFVTNDFGVALVASHREWRFRTLTPLTPERARAFRTRASLPDRALRPLPPLARGEIDRSVPTGQMGWQLHLRRDARATVTPVRHASMVGAVLFVLALSGLLWSQRQRARSARQRTTELEAAVKARTAELTLEMEERAASEARAAELREGLRQANRLATLGQVTASVAHETAQPVQAIRTYAETSEILLDRGETAGVLENLAAIRRLSDRIGTVTNELRGFARRRPGEVRPILLSEIIDGALLILKEQLRPIELDRSRVDADIKVLGGRVRLEQVLVNLIQNAIEALAGTQRPYIAIQIDVGDEKIRVAIADNGPGIPPDFAERLFTPFVTSRANGLGLGLVIAHDIMVELGGSLRLLPSDQGARFELELQRA